ncbi:MAG TPA: hypothetical protein VF739_03230, partial [Ktedonobacterales bacterium]
CVQPFHCIARWARDERLAGACALILRGSETNARYDTFYPARWCDTLPPMRRIPDQGGAEQPVNTPHVV